MNFPTNNFTQHDAIVRGIVLLENTYHFRTHLGFIETDVFKEIETERPERNYVYRTYFAWGHGYWA